MKITRAIIKSVNKRTPRLVYVSTWDPFSKEHLQSVDEIKTNANALEMVAATIFLEPNPAKLVGLGKYFRYSSHKHTIDFLAQNLELEVYELFLTEDDLKLAAKSFFDFLDHNLTVGGIVLNYGQSFGKGPLGSSLAISEECQRRAWHLITLNENNLRVNRNLVFSAVLERDLSKAYEICGSRPIWREEDEILFGWPNGVYRASDLITGLDFNVVITNEQITKKDHSSKSFELVEHICDV